MNLQIANNIIEKHPETALCEIICDVNYSKKSIELIELIKSKAQEIEDNLQMEDIAKFKVIADSRKAYKAFGKDPSRYRLSAEALHRRILKKQDIYFINNLVDLTNQISLETKFSIGTYDLDKIQGDVIFEIAEQNASYEGINRGILNIEFLPAFRDEVGYFGNPTGDSERTMITQKTKRLLMGIISFSGSESLILAQKYAIQLLERYANATHIESKIIA